MTADTPPHKYGCVLPADHTGFCSLDAMTPPPGPRTALSSAIKEGGFGSTYDFTLGFQRGWDAATEQGVHEAEARAGLDVERRLLIDLAGAAGYHVTAGGKDGLAALDYMVKRVRAFLSAAAYGGRDGLREGHTSPYHSCQPCHPPRPAPASEPGP